MFGHKWEPAFGVVVESRTEQTTVEGRPGLHAVQVYVVDVHVDHATKRFTVPALPSMRTEVAVGTPVKLEVNHKTNEARFDPHSPLTHTGSAREALRVAMELRAGAAGGGAAGGAGAEALAARLAQLRGAGAAGAAGAPGVHVVSGQQGAELLQAIMTGGTDRDAAREKIRQLKAEMLAQATGQPSPGQHGAEQYGAEQYGGGPAGVAPAAAEGFSSGTGPSTFDQVAPSAPASPMTPAAPVTPSFGQPATSFDPVQPAAGFSPPAGPVSFTPPTSPATFGGSFSSPADQVSFTPPVSAGGGSFGAFGENKSDRIAQLQDQRDRGQLTQEQYQAQRQQILDEI